jgi:hypothetical protein
MVDRGSEPALPLKQRPATQDQVGGQEDHAYPTTAQHSIDPLAGECRAPRAARIRVSHLRPTSSPSYPRQRGVVRRIKVRSSREDSSQSVDQFRLRRLLQDVAPRTGTERPARRGRLGLHRQHQYRAARRRFEESGGRVNRLGLGTRHVEVEHHEPQLVLASRATLLPHRQPRDDPQDLPPIPAPGAVRAGPSHDRQRGQSLPGSESLSAESRRPLATVAPPITPTSHRGRRVPGGRPTGHGRAFVSDTRTRVARSSSRCARCPRSGTYRHGRPSSQTCIRLGAILDLARLERPWKARQARLRSGSDRSGPRRQPRVREIRAERV